ncbi:hypothetical protein CY0110_16617 [Crocosphaera chwakensis CCY0110]|uniref:Uncharacterized protein n=1 Tax=Crocosphaera chwakensis CCY0110 TaxID=391612 RepID=A3II05_9CHRO|nr:hypothetical protein CY0110_16617 [Crocosphaera chwakensis CCY0110]
MTLVEGAKPASFPDKIARFIIIKGLDL